MMSGLRTSAQALVVAASALAVSASVVQAGGLAVREQSTSSQGASFAGSAAGGDLSSMFWNPAAAGIAGWGFYTESHAALLIPDASLTGTAAGPGNPFPSSTDIGSIALIPASYASYRINKDLVLALSINSPFGLATKPETFLWQGSPVGQTAKMFTANAAPTLSYQIAPGLHIGAGVQLEYMSLKFKFFDGVGSAAADIKDELGVGFTAGILWQPSKSTSIGLGFRSSVEHKMDGSLTVPAAGGATAPINATFETPEIVTLSARQGIAPNTRLLGTIEWTNWSRFGVIPIVGSGPITGSATDRSLPGNWHDSWLYSVGLEFDYSQKLTLRTGVAFEKSPIQNATERLIQVPDSDRWWVSGGATYKYSEKLTFDFAYTHIFFDDAPFVRTGLTGAPTLTGEANQSADIISFSMKTKW
jgi:long-chain fatty acid transport protein